MKAFHANLNLISIQTEYKDAHILKLIHNNIFKFKNIFWQILAYRWSVGWIHETLGNHLDLLIIKRKTSVNFSLNALTLTVKYIFHLPNVSLSAQRAADPDKVLWRCPRFSCLDWRWSMRNGIGWSGVSVINLVINSWRQSKAHVYI